LNKHIFWTKEAPESLFSSPGWANERTNPLFMSIKETGFVFSVPL